MSVVFDGTKWERGECARCGRNLHILTPESNPNMEVCGPCSLAVITGTDSKVVRWVYSLVVRWTDR